MTPASLLHTALEERVAVWRSQAYACDEFPLISTLLDWCANADGHGSAFLRTPQLRSLETYWYLRLKCDTPHVLDLYREVFSSSSELMAALGLVGEHFSSFALDHGVNALLDKIQHDDDFVRSHGLESLRETITLDYPSYILALAMGAGKTILIGAIIATEFVMGMEYPAGPFVQNALVFAPGKTIIGSLRELASMPYQGVLPPRHHKRFLASVKLTFTRDKDKDIPLIRGSLFNIVVTNTEKIRIRKESILKSQVGALLPGMEDTAKQEVANLRLQAIASLPHLGVFSDEAHHTYGRAVGEELKKVRRTVDFLSEQTNLIVVVNTTGTPYFRRQILRDVVYWYGLAQGIADGYLKDLSGGVRAYDFNRDAAQYVAHVTTDFLKEYGGVVLPGGQAAKLAMYFPKTVDLVELRPHVEAAAAALGYGPDTILVNVSDPTLTTASEIDAFARLNEASSRHRIILLVDKGVEGWNCPSLFACCLARKLKTSNNFVLQASTRCLRQVPTNTQAARVYLSTENFAILDRQLGETYGESIQILNGTSQDRTRVEITVRKTDIPPVRIRMNRKVVRRAAQTLAAGPIKLVRPQSSAVGASMRSYTPATVASHERSLVPVSDESVEILGTQECVDRYRAALTLASNYRVGLSDTLAAVSALYPDEVIPLQDVADLGRQIEAQLAAYEMVEEQAEQSLRVLKLEGFDRCEEPSGPVYHAEASFRTSLGALLTTSESLGGLAHEIGFHYDPYIFDSLPERDFFITVLNRLDLAPADVLDVYFTGGISDPAKTEFLIDYADASGAHRRYAPDFLIRVKDASPEGERLLIVEIKAESQRQDPDNGESGRKAEALRAIASQNPGRLEYRMIFVTDAVVPDDAIETVFRLIRGSSNDQ